MGVAELFLLEYTVGPLFYKPLRPPLIIINTLFGPNLPIHMLNDLNFKATYTIRQHFLGPNDGLKLEGLLELYCIIKVALTFVLQCWS